MALLRYNNRKYRSGLSLVQKEKERKRVNKIYRGTAFLALAIVGIVIARNIVAIGLLGRNLVVAYKQDSRIAQGRTNIVLDYGQMALLSVDRVNHTMALLVLPKDVYASQDKGAYRLSAVYQAAEVKGEGLGGEALTNVAADIFGVPIDGYVKFTTPIVVDSFENERTNLAHISSLIKLFRTNNYSNILRTNLSTVDGIKLWRENQLVRFDRFSVYNLSQQNQLTQTELADGSKVLGVSDMAMDRVIQDLLIDPLIANEKQTVVVINASHINGLGTGFARSITHLGAQVVRVETAETKREQSEIRYTGKKPVKLIDRLSRMRRFTIIEGQDQGTIGDVTVILGDR